MIPKNEDAAQMGRRGHEARMRSTSPERRAEIARAAARARWTKYYERKDK